MDMSEIIPKGFFGIVQNRDKNVSRFVVYVFWLMSQKETKHMRLLGPEEEK